MSPPSTVDAYLELLRKSGILDAQRLDGYILQLKAEAVLPARPRDLGGRLVKDGLLTHFQARQILHGKWRGFMFGKYRVLEQLGAGGMSSVYLCEHLLMRRHVAIKVLPIAKSQDQATVARFYREARAAAALNHPNIARAFDVDQEGKLHFIVMEYVDGSSLFDIVRKHGAMDISRACHYVRQAAIGLQHIHANNLVHRDMKPGNLIVDRQGTTRILDLGLARFFSGEGGGAQDELTAEFDTHSMMGTADYISPEQAMNLHDVDIRADIYSLGATLYFLLAGRPPFEGKSITQKLVMHQMKQPESVTKHRPEVPAELEAVVERMMRKDPAERYQTPAEIAEALAPWTHSPIPPPPETEMPKLCAAALALTPAGNGLPSDLSGSALRRVTVPRQPVTPRSGVRLDSSSVEVAALVARDPSADSSSLCMPAAPVSDTVTEMSATADTKVNPRKTSPATTPDKPPVATLAPAALVEAKSRTEKRKALIARLRLRSIGTLLLLVLGTGLVAGVGGGVIVWAIMSSSGDRTAPLPSNSADSR